MLKRLNCWVKIYLASDKLTNGSYSSEPVNSGLVAEFKIRGGKAIIQWADRGWDKPPASTYSTEKYDIFLWKDENSPKDKDE